METKNRKLGVIVPYRKRFEHLNQFLTHIKQYLDVSNIDYEIIIVNQDNAKLFNRGALLNIGFLEAEKKDCDYVVFHDVDMLPIDVDYSYSNIPLLLATDFILEEGEKEREPFDQYFGGVTMFTLESFKKINGYSNKYWGWGYEDTDLLYRCVINDLPLRISEVKNTGKSGKVLEFNGVNSYVKGKNIFNINQNCTFFVSFKPNNLVLDHKKEVDNYTVFSIPGWDFSIFYNSFFRYSFCAFDNEHKPYSVNSFIKPQYKTNTVVTVNTNEKIISFFQDGELVGRTENYKKLHSYRKEPEFYLGAGNVRRWGSENFFSGTIDTFAFYDEVLSEEAIRDISTNEKVSLNDSFGSYKPGNTLKLYYDTNCIKDYKLMDLSSNNNHGKIQNCRVIRQHFSEYTDTKVPYRRKSLFKSLKHEENGFEGNKWKDQATRWNQLRFHNEVSLNRELLNEGLSTLTFLVHGRETIKDNITLLDVDI